MRSLTMVIPSLNEETNIVLTVEGILPFARKHLDDFRLILVNDGSDDGTGAAIDKLAAQYPQVSVIQHPVRRGVGTSYREGIALATMKFVTLIPGDNVVDPKTWGPLFDTIGSAELVVGSRANQGDSRQWYRVILSRIFTWSMCLIYRIKIKDFQGLVIYPTAVVQELGLRSTGYMYQLEMLVQLHRRGFRIADSPLYMLPEHTKGSRSLRFKTLLDLLQTMWRLFWLKSPVGVGPNPPTGASMTASPSSLNK